MGGHSHSNEHQASFKSSNHVGDRAAVTFLAMAVAYPLDTIATIVKSKVPKEIAPATLRQYLSTKKIPLLFRGFPLATIEFLSPYLIYFSIAQKQKRNPSAEMSDRKIISIATAMYMLPVFPNIVRLRMQSGLYPNLSWASHFQQIIKNEGFLRFLYATPLYLLLKMGNLGIFNSMLNSKRASNAKNREEVSFASKTFVALSAALISTTLFNPIDNLFVPYQVYDFSKSRHSSMQSVSREFLTSNIISGATRGFALRLVTNFINNVLFAVILDEVESFPSSRDFRK